MLHRTLCAILALASVAAGHHPHDIVSLIGVSPAFAKDGTLFIASPGSINLFLVSRDRGHTWQESRSGLRGSNFTGIELASDWATSGTAWAAMADVGIQRTTDFGCTWEKPTIRRQVFQMAVSPVGEGGRVAMFFATRTELFRSDDQGVTDRAVSIPLGPEWVEHIAVSPSFWQDQTVIVTTMNNRVLVSNDAGATWSVRRLAKKATAVAFSPDFAVDRTLWVSTWGGGVFRSTDGGATLSPGNADTPGSIAPGLNDPYVNDIAVGRQADAGANGDGLVLFVATKDLGLFESVDGARTWRRNPLHVHLTDQTPSHYLSVHLAPDWPTDRTVFCGAYEGMNISTDGGRTWRESNINPTRIGRLLETSPNFAEDRTVFASGYGMHLLVSKDGGDLWDVEWDMGAGSVYMIGVSPAYADDGLLLLGAAEGIFRSADRGRTWQWIPMPGHPKQHDPTGKLSHEIRSIEFVAGFGKRHSMVFAANSRGVVYRSDDAGATWTTFEPIGPGDHWTARIGVSPNFEEDRTMFVAADGVFRSIDGGETFELVCAGRTQDRGLVVAPDFATSRELYCVSQDRGFLLSKDGGDTWTSSGEGLDEYLPALVALSPAYAEDRTICAATFGGGFYRSTDRGRSWQRVSALGTPIDHATSLAISTDFANDRTIFAGAYDGQYRSRDGGATWECLTRFEIYDDHREPWEFKGGWTPTWLAGCLGRRLHVSAKAGASASLPFVGHGIQLFGARGPSQGIAEIRIDGELTNSVDLFGPEEIPLQVVFEKLDLKPGYHEIEVRVSGVHGDESAGASVNVDGAKVFYR